MIKSFFKKVLYPKNYSIHIIIQLVLSFVLISSILSIRLFYIGYAKAKTINFDRNIISISETIECSKDESIDLFLDYKEKIENTIDKDNSKIYYSFSVPYQKFEFINNKDVKVIFYYGDIKKIVGINSFNATIDKLSSDNGIYVSDTYKDYSSYSIKCYHFGEYKNIYQINDISGYIKNIPDGQEKVIYLPISYYDFLLDEEITSLDTKLEYDLLLDFDKNISLDDIDKLRNININVECHDTAYKVIIDSYENIFQIVNYFLAASAIITMISVIILFCMKIYNNKNTIYIESIYYCSDTKIMLKELLNNIFTLLISYIISLILIVLIDLIVYLITNIYISIAFETWMQMIIVFFVIFLITLIFTKIIILINNKTRF